MERRRIMKYEKKEDKVVVVTGFLPNQLRSAIIETCKIIIKKYKFDLVNGLIVSFCVFELFYLQLKELGYPVDKLIEKIKKGGLNAGK